MDSAIIIALEHELEEGDLVIPVNHVAFYGRSLSTSEKGLTKSLHVMVV